MSLQSSVIHWVFVLSEMLSQARPRRTSSYRSRKCLFHACLKFRSKRVAYRMKIWLILHHLILLKSCVAVCGCSKQLKILSQLRKHHVKAYFRMWAICSSKCISRLVYSYCCDRKSRATCAQSFAPRQQAAIEIMRRNLSYYCLLAPRIYIFVLRAHPVRGESHNERNTAGEVATQLIKLHFNWTCENLEFLVLEKYW